MQSFCPVGEIVVTLNAEGVKKVGDNREGVDGSSNKVGDAERDEVTHDGVTVFQLEEYIDGLKEGIAVGAAEVKQDGETVGYLDEYTDGLNVGIIDGRLVSLTV